MHRGKVTGKSSGKPARQLLFSEALRQQKHPPAKDPPPHPHTTTGNMAEGSQGASMDRILQEISAVGRKLEGMDSAMMALTAETRSMRLEITGFQSQISGLDQRGAQTRSKEAGREGMPSLNHSLPIAPWSSSPTAADSPGARSTTAGHPGNLTFS
ncbi:hypothetical protein NDU88_006775 [Pleurodeles waltl]|uniref:Uncharacterized protein n=1 Tax=Pleurodeles waltl TaxID=8319 RepID=A0AAV7TXR4_PLEWA|nr:hypothetical protein NDU88_006775 [Pleurodeles waltl]